MTTGYMSYKVMPRSCSVVKKELDSHEKIGPTFFLSLAMQTVARIARQWARKAHVTKLALGMPATTVFSCARHAAIVAAKAVVRGASVLSVSKIRIAAHNGSMLALQC